MPKIFYGGGFYIEGVHTSDQIPADAVEISNAEYQALMTGQSQGQRIVAGPEGKPMLADQPSPGDDPDVAMANLRATRNVLLGQTDSLVARHRDQVEAGWSTSLTPAQFQALQKRRQELRDITTTRKNNPWTAHLALLDELRKA